MNSKEIYEELSSGRWLLTLISRAGYVFPEEGYAEVLANRASVHFQEMLAAYHDALAQEASEQEAERIRVTEDIEANPDKAKQYREDGWSVTKRAKKVVHLDRFLADHSDDIPREALAIVKSKLPTPLKKILENNYEQTQGYSYTVKRSKTED